MIALLVCLLSLTGCKKRTSLLSPETLNAWIENGYQDDFGRKVVILDTGFDWSLDNRSAYEAGHIPGAHYISPVAFYNGGNLRSDGPVLIPFMVTDGPSMDELLQSLGIERQTVVVFTGNHIWGSARAYWVFRYWGFSRHQLYILDGMANGPFSVWEEAGFELQTIEPVAPQPSTFSVSELCGNMDNSRASTQEFFEVSSGADPDRRVIDARSEGEYNGLLIPPPSGSVNTDVFGFRVKDSIWYNWANALIDGESGDHRFKSAEALAGELAQIGISPETLPYAFCYAGGRGAVLYFVFDGILRRPAKLHDGSSMELGQLGYLEDTLGNPLALPADSPWRFDQEIYLDIIHYNAAENVLPPLVLDPYAPRADLINETDKAYSMQ